MRLAIFNKQKMPTQNNSRKNGNFRIFVVRTIDDFVENTFMTGVSDFIFVPVNEAKRYAGKREDCYIATDNEEISQKYGIQLIKINI